MKVIQIGIGGMGNAWLGAVNRSPHVDFAAHVEINSDIADRQAAAYGLSRERIYSTLREALSNVEADAVIDVTPPQFHRDNAIIALEAGLPVLSEKPLATTLDDARAIVQAAERTGVLHSVAQNYRYRPLTQTIKRVLDSGELGVCGAVFAEFCRGPHFGGFREQMPQPLIIDMAIHHFDLLRFFLGSDASQVSAQSWNPAWSWYAGDAGAAAQILFSNGAQASYRGSWASQGFETSWNANWHFDCERGVMLAQDDVIRVQRLLQGGDGERGAASVFGAPEVLPQADMPREGQDYLLQEFVDAVRNGGKTATHAADNIRTIELVFAVARACETGEVMPVG